MKQVVVRPAAAADIEDAYQWYESQRPGRGADFLAALRSTQDRVIENPEAYPILHRDTRRAVPLWPLLPGPWRHDRRRSVHACQARSPALARSRLMANHTLQRTENLPRNCRHFQLTLAEVSGWTTAWSEEGAGVKRRVTGAERPGPADQRRRPARAVDPAGRGGLHRPAREPARSPGGLNSRRHAVDSWRPWATTGRPARERWPTHTARSTERPSG